MPASNIRNCPINGSMMPGLASAFSADKIKVTADCHLKETFAHFQVLREWQRLRLNACSRV